ncbi:Neu5Ac permease [Ruegeria sp. THAF57]|uniref:TRAP transporter large permease n=1 Tax=Ruegeria sp. THAF57 TaxID=2744555 RepID=UPI0015DF0D75|nr:TRAP transporter large permease [Ruegeria sp. THAF57]CAD0187208.1 Neu5Ac permease [Ruegeria sp. THAF57]
MTGVTIGLGAFASALFLLAIRVPIAFALGLVATVATFITFLARFGLDRAERAFDATGTLIYSGAFEILHSFDLSMVPLFIALGHVSYHAQITTKIYYAARVWLTRLPGGLAVASIIGCGGFSAITGSSLACASTMGRICSPEMLKAGYDPRLATGSVAAGGTLGSLIPPSVLFIIYGIFTETSISQLFLAGIIPGLLTLIGYVLAVTLWVRRNPEIAPVFQEEIPRQQRMAALIGAWPAVFLFVIIIGGIYGGVFTATEAAAVSLIFAIAIGVVQRTLTWQGLKDSMLSTCAQAGTIFLLAACAKMFVGFVSLTGISGAIVQLATSVDLSQLALLAMVVVIYLLLGMFLDPIGILVLTLPVLIPLVEDYNLDLIWFGVVVVKLLEIGLITPPVGLNVFVIGGVIDKSITVDRIFAGVLRFLASDIVVLVLLVAFPILSLLIPYSM